MKITSKQLRRLWIDFYVERGHKDVGAVSLISEGDTTVLFNVAGMQPIMPYLLGQPHPLGRRLVNIQGCIRTNDIEEVGDERHLTFFEMMGSWSLGDYFKEERTKWSFELLTKVFGFSARRLAATVFEGDKNAPRDDETAKLREKSGFLKQNIYYLGKKDNWWELERGPCGPDSEMFYITDKPACGKNCNPACNCGRFVEIGNDVFMQYERVDKDKYIPLKSKNVDTGWGFERNLAFLNGTDDVYKTDLFAGTIKLLEKQTDIKYLSQDKYTKAYRIICDHIRTSAMLLGDQNKVVPSNVGAGYILRRLLRRAIRYANSINLGNNILTEIALIFINGIYDESYPNLKANKNFIVDEINKECEKFNKTLTGGIKEFNKLIENQAKFSPDNKVLSGDKVFRLYDTFGFPMELTKEMAAEHGFAVDEAGYGRAFKTHQEKSKTADAGVFKGGLAEQGIETTKLHTATHLLHNALIRVLNGECRQMGSNINPERLRFDFAFNRKLTDEELKKTENLVNEAIKKCIPVVSYVATVDEAKSRGAIGIFDSKYGEKVTVYEIAGFGSEICGGPHVKNTKELGRFKIIKEEASSAGVRRIKAVLE